MERSAWNWHAHTKRFSAARLFPEAAGPCALIHLRLKLQSTYQTECETAPSQGQPVYVRSTFHNMLLLTATQSPKRNWSKDRSYHTRQVQSADSRGALASFAALVTALTVVAASCPLLGRRFRRSIGLGLRLRLRLLFGQQGTQCALHFRCLL